MKLNAKTAPEKAGRSRTGHSRTRDPETGHAKAGHQKSGHEKPGRGKPDREKPWHEKPGREKAAHEKAGPTQRQLRVAEEIRHVMSGIFTRNEFRDPDLAAAHITVTEVRISPDLRKATAFITRLGRSDVDLLIPALVRATPYLRGQVAKALRLRVAPDLTFTPDVALDYAMKIDALMHRPEIARDLGKPTDPETVDTLRPTT